MSNKILWAGFFLAGTAVGSLITRGYLKSKYERISQEEIDSVKQMYSLKEQKKAFCEGLDDGLNANPDLEIVKAVQKIEKKFKYAAEEGGKEPMEKPYVISPEEFGDFDDYEQISLTYYADGNLTDENDELIENVEDIVGEESLEHFGEYDEDAVYVRNDRLKCDYEILLDQRDFFALYRQ